MKEFKGFLMYDEIQINQLKTNSFEPFKRVFYFFKIKIMIKNQMWIYNWDNNLNKNKNKQILPTSIENLIHSNILSQENKNNIETIRLSYINNIIKILIIDYKAVTILKSWEKKELDKEDSKLLLEIINEIKQWNKI